jgi:HK97 family phage major capsid protein
MTTFIEQELRFALDDETNIKLMNGVNSGTVPAGIQTLSVAYSLVGVSTNNANNWDAIVAAVAQLRAGNLKGRAVAFVNPVDYANMRLTKAVNQGQLFVPAQSGAEIVEDNNIPVGYVQVALIDYYRILIYKDITITTGWENDDFTKNLLTFIAERRLHQFFNDQYTGFAIYDTFANIKAAIEEA